MLKNTPLLELVFDEPDSVRWDDAAKLVRVLERQVHENYRRISLTKGASDVDQATYRASRVRARIAGPIVRGSVILPLSFELLDVHLQVFNVARDSKDALTYIGEVIGLMADATDLLDFTLGVLFGRSGVLSGNRGRPPAEPEPGALARVEAEVAARLLRQRVNLASDLMTGAQATGCDYVAIRWGDGEIVIHRSGAEAQAGAPELAGGDTLPASRLIRRTSDEVINVRVDGHVFPAFLGQGGRYNETFLLVWASRSPLPPLSDAGLEIIGRFVAWNQVTPQNGFPDKWSVPGGVFLVQKSRIADFE